MAADDFPWWRCIHCGCDEYEERVFTGHMKGVAMVHCANCKMLHSQPDPDSKQALRWQISELAEALERCRDKFAEYATLHLAKGTRDGILKAQTNADMANLVCGAALASVGRNAERQDRVDGLGPKDEHAVGAASAETPNQRTTP